MFTEHLDHSVSGHKWLVISDSSRFCHTMGRMEAAEYSHVDKRLRGHRSFYFALWAKKPDSAPAGEGGGGLMHPLQNLQKE